MCRIVVDHLASGSRTSPVSVGPPSLRAIVYQLLTARIESNVEPRVGPKRAEIGSRQKREARLNSLTNSPRTGAEHKQGGCELAEGNFAHVNR